MKVGVIIPIHAPFNGPKPLAPTYASIKGIAKAAEDSGLDSAWITDHLLFRFPDQDRTLHSHEAFTIWAGLAEATSRIELGSMVLCTAFRNPAMLAKEAVSLDAVANQRITLGLGCGWHEPEFKAFGIPFTNIVSRFEEALSIIHPLLRTGNVTFAGEHYRAVDCDLVPPDDRPGGIPILIAATRPRMLELTAKFADQWNSAWWGDASRYRTASADLNAACERVGRDPATIAKTAGIMIEFTDDAVSTESYDPERFIKGPLEHVAEKLSTYAESDCAHVICNLAALDEEKTTKLAEAAKQAGLLTAS